MEPMSAEHDEIITINHNVNGKKASKGRRRVEIKRVEEKNKRHVTFSKRKKGFFNKAAELSVLSGAEMAGIVISGNGKVFCFGSPTPDAVIDRYLGQNPNHHDQNCGGLTHSRVNNNAMRGGSNRQVEDYMEAKRRMEAEKMKRESESDNKNNNIGDYIVGGESGSCCYGWWEKPVDTTAGSLEELEEYMAALHKLKSSVEDRTNQMITNLGCNFSSLMTMDDRFLAKGEQFLM